jgi:hypothetical protein
MKGVKGEGTGKHSNSNLQPKTETRGDEKNSASREVHKSHSKQLPTQPVKSEMIGEEAQSEQVQTNDASANVMLNPGPSSETEEEPRDARNGESGVSENNENFSGESLQESETSEVNSELQPEWSVNAMAMALPKSTLDLDADDLQEQFKLFKFEHENKMTLSNIPAANKAARAAAFKLDLPLDARKIIMNTDWAKNGKDPDSIDDIIAVLCEVKRKKSSKILAKNKFHNRQMHKKERFVDYKQTLLMLIEQCGYPADMKETMVRDQIIRGHHDESLRRQMLMLEDAATLDQVSEICEKYEDSNEAAKEISRPGQQIHALNDQTKKNDKNKKNDQQRKNDPKPDAKNLWKCTNFCGGRHMRGHKHCPAYNKTCSKCGRKNHFEEVCRKPPLSGWVPRSKAAEEHHQKMIAEHVYELEDRSHPYDEEQRSSRSPTPARGYVTDTDDVRSDSTGSDSDRPSPQREVKVKAGTLKVTTRSTKDLRNVLEKDGRKSHHPQRFVELVSEAVEVQIQTNDNSTSKVSLVNSREERRGRKERSPRTSAKKRSRSPSPKYRRHSRRSDAGERVQRDNLKPKQRDERDKEKEKPRTKRNVSPESPQQPRQRRTLAKTMTSSTSNPATTSKPTW